MPQKYYNLSFKREKKLCFLSFVNQISIFKDFEHIQSQSDNELRGWTNWNSHYFRKRSRVSYGQNVEECLFWLLPHAKRELLENLHTKMLYFLPSVWRDTLDMHFSGLSYEDTIF